MLSNFPVLSETFILNEILELEAQGVAPRIFALRRPPVDLVHEDVARLRAPVDYLPGPAALLQAHRRLAAAPGGRYRRQLAAAARHGPEELWRFFAAGWIAVQTMEQGLTHLHAHFAHHPALVAMYASGLSGIPYSFTAHAMDLFRRRVDHRTLARKMAAARLVVTVSEYNMAFLRRVAPSQEPKLVMIRCGIDLDRFAPSPPPPMPFRILCVARLVEKKGISVLIEACGRLQQRGFPFQCEVIGQGPLRPRLEGMIRERNLDGTVHLLGAATHAEVGTRYAAAHAFVLPCLVARDGDRDGLPVSLLEAMACGLPVVSTPVAGIPELLRDRDNGLLVPPQDATALADAIALLMADPALWGRLGARARQAVAETCDLHRTVAELRARFEATDPPAASRGPRQEAGSLSHRIEWSP